jgi:hypothetical protein
MEQKIPDTPRTMAEYKRQKGPIPLSALFLAIGLLAVFALFWGLPLLESLFEN